MTLSFIAYGKPEPQGSAKAFVPKGWTRAVVTSDNPKNKGWRRTVGFAALAARPRGFAPFEGPVTLAVDFYLPRPKALKGSSVLHATRPDADKLARSIADALTSILYVDDGQIAHLIVSKLYADAGTEPRAEISVTGTS